MGREEERDGKNIQGRELTQETKINDLEAENKISYIKNYEKRDEA